MTAMAVPILVWLGAGTRGRYAAGLVMASFVPVLLATYMTSSRGALIASLIGTGVAIATNPHRGRSFFVLLVGVAGAVPAVAAATLANGILDEPWSGFGRAELVVCAAAGLGMAIVALAGPPTLRRLRSARFGRLRMSHVVVATIAIVAGLTILVGPGEIAGDFAAKEGREAIGSGDSTISVTGSGRAQFWSAALDAFASEPGRGIGAGGYETWWNRHGSLETPAQNAHSEPLELLAELGPLGLLAFVAFFAVVGAVGVRRVRWRKCAAAGAALGLLATAMVGLLIDWTWDLPAVMLPVLMAAAVLSTRALDYAGRIAVRRTDARPVAIRPRSGSGDRRRRPSRSRPSGQGACSPRRPTASMRAMTLSPRGQLDDAAQAARSAASVEPWASAPVAAARHRRGGGGQLRCVPARGHGGHRAFSGGFPLLAPRVDPRGAARQRRRSRPIRGSGRVSGSPRAPSRRARARARVGYPAVITARRLYAFRMPMHGWVAHHQGRISGLDAEAGTTGGGGRGHQPDGPDRTSLLRNLGAVWTPRAVGGATPIGGATWRSPTSARGDARHARRDRARDRDRSGRLLFLPIWPLLREALRALRPRSPGASPSDRRRGPLDLRLGRRDDGGLRGAALADPGRPRRVGYRRSASSSPPRSRRSASAR